MTTTALMALAKALVRTSIHDDLIASLNDYTDAVSVSLSEPELEALYHCIRTLERTITT